MGKAAAGPRNQPVVLFRWVQLWHRGGAHKRASAEQRHVGTTQRSFPRNGTVSIQGKVDRAMAGRAVHRVVLSALRKHRESGGFLQKGGLKNLSNQAGTSTVPGDEYFNRESCRTGQPADGGFEVFPYNTGQQPLVLLFVLQQRRTTGVACSPLCVRPVSPSTSERGRLKNDATFDTLILFVSLQRPDVQWRLQRAELTCGTHADRIFAPAGN